MFNSIAHDFLRSLGNVPDGSKSQSLQRCHNVVAHDSVHSNGNLHAMPALCSCFSFLRTFSNEARITRESTEMNVKSFKKRWRSLNKLNDSPALRDSKIRTLKWKSPDSLALQSIPFMFALLWSLDAWMAHSSTEIASAKNASTDGAKKYLPIVKMELC